jgi:hypothetical protein
LSELFSKVDFLDFPTIRKIFHGAVSGISGSLQHAQARNQLLQESTEVDLSVLYGMPIYICYYAL